MTGTFRPATSCPDPADLAAFVDQKLTGEARAAVVAHLAGCDDCREVYADAVRLAPRSRVLSFPRTVKYGGGAFALAASLLIIVRVQPAWLGFGPTPYEELVAAVGTNRTVEGRLTGGFSHGPLQPPTRSAGRDSTARYELLAAAARIERSAAENPTAANLHALGVAYLLVSREDEAIRNLEDAAEQSHAASVQSDLAAAYLARGRQSAAPADYERAAAAARLALVSDPNLAEARFNLALALEMLNQPAEAQRTWREYSSRHNDEWAAEARRRADAGRSSTPP